MMKLTLKALRINYGMTQAQFAKAAGISRYAISCYETGRTMPNIKTAKRISRVFNVNIDDILFCPYVSLNDTKQKED